MPRGTDRYGRMLAVCFEAAGDDLNRLDGDPTASAPYRQFSHRYVGEQSAARAARRGISGTEFEMPWEGRRGTEARGAASRDQPVIR